MFAQIATFLIDTIASFLVFLLLARFHFQWLRVPFRNPMGEFLLATTSWLVVPARRFHRNGRLRFAERLENKRRLLLPRLKRHIVRSKLNSKRHS